MTHNISSDKSKRGAGKTTFAINLCSQLASKDFRVRLFDVDPQASATRWAQRDVSQNLRFAVIPLHDESVDLA